MVAAVVIGTSSERSIRSPSRVGVHALVAKGVRFTATSRARVSLYTLVLRTMSSKANSVVLIAEARLPERLSTAVRPIDSSRGLDMLGYVGIKEAISSLAR